MRYEAAIGESRQAQKKETSHGALPYRAPARDPLGFRAFADLSSRGAHPWLARREDGAARERDEPFATILQLRTFQGLCWPESWGARHHLLGRSHSRIEIDLKLVSRGSWRNIILPTALAASAADAVPPSLLFFVTKNLNKGNRSRGSRSFHTVGKQDQVDGIQRTNPFPTAGVSNS